MYSIVINFQKGANRNLLCLTRYFQKIRKRRGVSQIIGSIFALAIVAAFGSVLLIQGVQGIENFTSFLNVFEETESKSVNEALIIEHVRFDPDSKQIDVWIRNTGLIEIKVDQISIVKIDSQELIVNKDALDNDIFQKEVKQITISDSDVSMPSGSTDWDEEFSNDPDADYKITVTTAGGKSFETISNLFNS